jgi:predicted nucleic acid-binding protein
VKQEKVYWDSSAFLAYLKRENGRFDDCKKVLDAFERGELVIGTSTETIVEVAFKVRRDKVTPELESELDLFFQKRFEYYDVDRNIATSARGLLWKHRKLHTKDAIHVATAIRMKADELHSYDEEHLIPLDGEIGGLKICAPNLLQTEISGATKDELTHKKPR